MLPRSIAPRQVLVLAALAVAAPIFAAATVDAGGSERVTVKDGTWTGTATDDKFGDSGSVEFRVRNDGRSLRSFRINDITGDCALGPNDTLNVVFPRAKIQPNGRLSGHHVVADPGERPSGIISYSGRFTKNRLTDGRIYQDNNLDGAPSSDTTGQCEVAAASFTATRGG